MTCDPRVDARGVSTSKPATEVAGHLRTLGFSGPDALADWAGVVNLENRLVPDAIDTRVLAELRKAASA